MSVDVTGVAAACRSVRKCQLKICMSISCERLGGCCDRRSRAHELHGSLRFPIYLFSQLNAGTVVVRVRPAIAAKQMCVHASWVSSTKIDNRQPKPTAETKPAQPKQKKRINERFKPQNWVIILTKLKLIRTGTTHNEWMLAVYMMAALTTTNWHRTDGTVHWLRARTEHDTFGSCCRSTLNAYESHTQSERVEICKQIPIVTESHRTRAKLPTTDGVRYGSGTPMWKKAAPRSSASEGNAPT